MKKPLQILSFQFGCCNFLTNTNILPSWEILPLLAIEAKESRFTRCSGIRNCWRKATQRQAENI